MTGSLIFKTDLNSKTYALNIGDYPYQKLMNLFVEMNYKGWILLEARTEPEDRVVAMKEQLEVFNAMISKG